MRIEKIDEVIPLKGAIVGQDSTGTDKTYNVDYVNQILANKLDFEANANNNYIPTDGKYLDATGMKYNNSLLSDILGSIYNFDKKYYGGQTLNINDFTNSGLYEFDVNNTVTNAPIASVNQFSFLIVLNGAASNSGIQIWFTLTTVLYYRVRTWGNWSSWKQITIT